ncbi:hypothetical protein [Janibacter melonis]|uniref:hypothetical protein n=1 Tax=Janibacter melonis TaxID=262209 RepID=UPI001785F824
MDQTDDDARGCAVIAVGAHEGERTGTLATMCALQALGGPSEPMAVHREAMAAVDALAARGTLAGEDVRRARLAVLGRLWQGYGVPGSGPHRYWERGWWVARFRELGWAQLWGDGPPPSPLSGGGVLYRGAVEERLDGLSWTPDREVAAWFAAQYGGSVWQVSAPPASRFLVGLPMELRGSGLPVSTEYVLDVVSLDVVAA